MNDSLKSINKILAKRETDKHTLEIEIRTARIKEIKKEKKKEQSLHGMNPKGFKSLDKSDIWNKTLEENRTLVAFSNKMRGYRTVNNTQEMVLLFASTSSRFIQFTNEEEVNTYIKKSQFWDRTYTVVENRSGKKIRITYARNVEMKCIIVRYLSKIIITTESSFSNIIKQTGEGK